MTMIASYGPSIKSSGTEVVSTGIKSISVQITHSIDQIELYDRQEERVILMVFMKTFYG